MSSLKLKTQTLSSRPFLIVIAVIIIAGIALLLFFGLGQQSETVNHKPVPGSSYLAILKQVQGLTLVLEAEPSQNPNIKQTKTIKAKTTPQTVFLERKRPASIPQDIDPSHLFKQKFITLKDLNIGDTILISDTKTPKTVIVLKTIE